MIYKALALQTTCFAVNACGMVEAKDKMLANIARVAAQIRASKTFMGQDTRLVVLPEYFMTGYPTFETLAEWRVKACIEIGAQEYEALSTIAQQNKIFLCGNAYELDRHFAELYFQTNFIIAPSGEVVLRYRRLNSMFAPTPHDVWDKYLDIYGLEGVFPIAKTEIGNLATIASEEILYPEIARCLAIRGAEIFLHPTSEVASPQRTPKDVCKLARAIENMAYLVSANSAGIADSAIPMASTDGKSKIVDYRGLVLAEADSGESMVANAEIDLNALRAARARLGMNNLLARQRFELYAQSYAQNSFYPPNSLLNNAAPDKSIFIQTQQQTIEKLKNLGII
jgi:predicted amidohydrolase